MVWQIIFKIIEDETNGALEFVGDSSVLQGPIIFINIQSVSKLHERRYTLATIAVSLDGWFSGSQKKIFKKSTGWVVHQIKGELNVANPI